MTLWNGLWLTLLAQKILKSESQSPGAPLSGSGIASYGKHVCMYIVLKQKNAKAS
jgi:hypothetical protein